MNNEQNNQVEYFNEKKNAKAISPDQIEFMFEKVDGIMEYIRHRNNDTRQRNKKLGEDEPQILLTKGKLAKFRKHLIDNAITDNDKYYQWTENVDWDKYFQ